LATFLPILTAGAYLVGKAYHCAYLNAFYVPCKLVTKTTTDYFIYSYIALRSELIGFSLASILLTLLTIGAAAIIKKFRDRAKASKHNRPAVFFQPIKAGRLSVNTSSFPLLLGGAVCVLISVTGLVMLPERIGGEAGFQAANEEKKIFQDGCTQGKNEFIFCNDILAGDRHIARGFILDVSEKYVMVYENSRARAIPATKLSFMAVVPPSGIGNCTIELKAPMSNRISVSRRESQMWKELGKKIDCPPVQILPLPRRAN
jgi:hypothetical protein